MKWTFWTVGREEYDVETDLCGLLHKRRHDAVLEQDNMHDSSDTVIRKYVVERKP